MNPEYFISADKSQIRILKGTKIMELSLVVTEYGTYLRLNEYQGRPNDLLYVRHVFYKTTFDQVHTVLQGALDFVGPLMDEYILKDNLNG